MSEQRINYHAAKSLLEQSGISFRDPNVVYSTGTREEVVEEVRVKKTRASKSQLRREAMK